MNELPRSLSRETTRSGEGWPRIAWTNEDLDRMVEAGLLAPGDRVELIGGEIIPMAPKGHRHERVRRRLAKWIYRRLREDLDLLAEPGWRPEPKAYFEPDLLIVPERIGGLDFPGSEVLLLIEVADSSHSYDTTVKRDGYARLAIPEYWVVHPVKMTTRIFREPSQSGYASTVDLGPSDLLLPVLVPEVSLRLTDLGIG